MAEPISLFVLPRTDWVDAEGRIYKDALIENLNAIEAKLQEISGLDIFDITLPDISSITVPDTTINSSDDSVINLRSFLNMVEIADYPIECSFNGTKLTKLTWWHNNHYNRKTNVETGASSTDKWVFFMPEDGTVSATSGSIGAGAVLIGMYTGGKIRGINANKMVGISLLKALSEMTMENRTEHKSKNTQITNYTNEGRSIGWAQTQTKGSSFDFTMKDVGRNYKQ